MRRLSLLLAVALAGCSSPRTDAPGTDAAPGTGGVAPGTGGGMAPATAGTGGAVAPGVGGAAATGSGGMPVSGDAAASETAPVEAGAAPSPTLWSRPVGNARGLAGANSEVFVTGSFTGAMSFGSAPVTSAGQEDVFVARYDGAGQLGALRSFGGTARDEGTAIALAPNGDVIVSAVSYSTTVDLGGGHVVTGVVGQKVFFVAWLDRTLAIKRVVTQLGGYGIAVDADGNVAVPRADDAPGPALTKLAPDGRTMWADASSFGLGAAGVVTGPAGGFVLYGNFYGNLTAGGVMHSSRGALDVVLIGYDRAGKVLWSKAFGGKGTQSALHATSDGSGNVVLACSFNHDLDLEGRKHDAGERFDTMVTKLAGGTGAIAWAQVFAGVDNTLVGALLPDAEGAPLVMVESRAIDFGGGMRAPGNFVVRLSAADGVYRGDRPLPFPVMTALRVGPSTYNLGGSALARMRVDF